MCSWVEEEDAADLVSAAHHRNILSISASDPISLVLGGTSCIKVIQQDLFSSDLHITETFESIEG